MQLFFALYCYKNSLIKNTGVLVNNLPIEHFVMDLMLNRKINL